MYPDPLAAAARGLAVFALQPGSKLVYAPGWQQAAITDPDVLAKTWRPGDNVGVGCWKSTVLGIDLDTKEPGVNGIARFAAWCERYGQPWPDTLTVRTPSQGLHLYLKVPPGVLIGSTAGRHPRSPLGPGIDTRGPGRGGRGGYLVGPGSIVDGRPYVIEYDAPMAACPTWLANLLALPATPNPPHRRSTV
ncbi:bifunctional DNA primase/polymerase [Nonomuraea sp. NPDC050394]|uniref:bifunctional DNA primase/polymerase n=1 Tax=Nonomuraea sp. NPDC050394 TaxID=3364363 RepID=UPI0037B8868E